jgi:guanosine-3',5'-bis(diphosphate) 3'-pyrophosphohydrolase
VQAILHDTIEDTKTTADELREHFGEKITSIVLDVTDDKSITDKARRKALQIEHAPHISYEAKLVKLADKISNLRDIKSQPPADWSDETKQQYFEWAKKVIAGVRGTNKKLEDLFDSLYESNI